MTELRYLFSDKKMVGFHLKGHSTADEQDEIGRLVCAFVSSAAYMTANTLTEIVGAEAEITVDEQIGEMYLKVLTKQEAAEPMLLGFKLHIEQLAQQFSDNITIISEV